MKYESRIKNKKRNTTLARASIFFVFVAVAIATIHISPSPVCAQTVPETCPNFGLERTTIYNLQDAAYAYGYAVAVDGANNTYVTGEQYVPATGLDMYVIKYDQNGNVVWSDAYDAGGNESGYGIAVDAGGNNVYVVGRQQDDASLNSDAFVRKYDAAGAMAWTQAYNSGGAGADIARGAALDGSGNVYAAGYRAKAGGGIEAMLLSYDANGTLRGGFPVSYAAPYNASAHGVAVSGANVYITGYTQPTVNNTDMFVRAYATSGSLQWAQTYDSISYTEVTIPQSTLVAGTTWANCPIGSTVVSATDTGQGTSSLGGGPSHGITTSLTGCIGWETPYNVITSTSTDPFGNIITTTVPGYAQCTFTCSAYTQTASNGNFTDIGYGVSVDSAGAVFVTGYQDTNGGDSFLRKYNSAGVLAWGETYNSNGSQNDVGRGVTSGNSGRIFVAGRQQTNAEDMILNEYYSSQLTFPIVPPPTQQYNTSTFTPSRSGNNCGNLNSPPIYGNLGLPNGCTCLTNQLTLSPTCTFNSYMSGGNNFASCVYWCDLQPLLPTTYQSLPLPDAYLYKGDQAGMPEYSEMAFGVAAAPSSNPSYASTANDVYVVGYQSSHGGEAFLNKYSCNAAQGTGTGTGTSLIANFSVTPTSGPDPLTVNADARGSAGIVTNYEWDWSYDGATFNNEGAGALASHTYTAVGTYTIALRITDPTGQTSSATVSVNVSQNQPPTASFTVCDVNNNNCVPPAAAPFTGVMPLRVNVDAAASADPNAFQGGYVASFSWDWGDGMIAGVGEKATHLYASPGAYTVTLTVTDNGGLSDTAAQNVSVIDQYVCAPACSGATPVCGPGSTIGATQCYACRADKECGAGYQCLGTSCAAGTQCPDGALCPADGKCPETATCNPLASGATCPDGSLCPANGFCPAAKNICTLSGSAVNAQCYIEEQGSCVTNADCTESIIGGVCDTASGSCRYARCANDTSLSCTTDNDCAEGDGICNSGACVYVYDCAYGLGLGGGVAGLYAVSSPDTMPKMPLGVQPDGQACTQPTSDAPNNCEGINGCLYYNYYSATGMPLSNSNNSVANCINSFEGGTGCMYYQYYSPLATATTPTTKTNCLPRYAEKSKKSPQAGIPEGCFVVDKGTRGKEYNCTAIDGCYYYLDGSVDCTYKEITATACTTNAECVAASTLPLMIPVCNVAARLCEYQGNGCVYEPNPKGAISCPGATSPATGGDNFVYCLLNPDSALPGFLNTSNNALSSCNVNADCPADEICLSGTCYPQCQANVDCASGEQCTTTCNTSLDCAGGFVCSAAGVCVPPLCAGATPSGTLWNVTMAYLGLTTSMDSSCRYSTDITAPYTAMAPFSTTGTTSHSEPLSGLTDGSYAYYVLCQELSSSVLAGLCQINFNIDTLMCVPGTYCPDGQMCPANGICPETPACAGAFPTGSLPLNTTATTMGLTTAQDAMCSYSLIVTDPYASMTPFMNTGAINHSTDVTGLLVGTNTYYAKCQDVVTSAITNACRISFGVGDDCTSNSQCSSGYQCINGTCQPPVCSGATPVGALAPETTSTTIGMMTDADANCRYSTNVSDTYSAMTPFITTGRTTHSSSVSGLVTGGNTHYVRCQDVVTSAEKFCQIPFSVGVCNREYQCDTGFMCIPNIGTGICTPSLGCTPGTLCPDGQLCPADGICPPPLNFCSYGTVYNAASGVCENCAINSSLPGCAGWQSFCALNPTHPLCAGSSGGLSAIPSGTTSCNTLGYTFTGTAITPSGNCDLVAIILALLSWFAWIIALLAVLSGLRAAYLYITSMGDERKLILARRYLIYTTIGVAVAVLTFSIVAITRAILNI